MIGIFDTRINKWEVKYQKGETLEDLSRLRNLCDTAVQEIIKCRNERIKVMGGWQAETPQKPIPYDS